MYSVVLMMALTGGAESTDFGHKCKCSAAPACAPACAPVCAPAPVCSCSGKKKLLGGGGLFHKKSCSCTAAPVCAPVCAPACPPACSGAVMTPAPAKDMPKEPMPAPANKTKTTSAPTTGDVIAAEGTVTTVAMPEYRMVSTPTVRGRLFGR